MSKATFVLILFAIAVASFTGAWWIAAIGPVLDGSNFNAWLAAAGYFATAAFFVERLR